MRNRAHAAAWIVRLQSGQGGAVELLCAVGAYGNRALVETRAAYARRRRGAGDAISRAEPRLFAAQSLATRGNGNAAIARDERNQGSAARRGGRAQRQPELSPGAAGAADFTFRVGQLRAVETLSRRAGRCAVPGAGARGGIGPVGARGD